MKTVLQKFICIRCQTVLVACLLTLVHCLLGAAIETNFQRMKILALERFGESGPQAIERWQRFLEQSANLTALDKVLNVNDYINLRVHYQEDLQLWGQKDYWATPLEALSGGSGDCEDYALAKFLSLRLLGIPAEKMRLTYVRAKISTSSSVKTRAHMVLAYFPEVGKPPLILDSLARDILPATQRPDLRPIFSFNTQALWVAGKNGQVSDPTSRLSHWRDVVRRMADEGTTW